MKLLLILAAAVILFSATVGNLRAQPNEPGEPGRPAEPGSTEPAIPPMIPGNPGDQRPDQRPAELPHLSLVHCGELVGEFTNLDGFRRELRMQFHRVWPKDAPAPHIEGRMEIAAGERPVVLRIVYVTVEAPGMLALQVEQHVGEMVSLSLFRMRFAPSGDDGGRVALWGSDSLDRLQGTWRAVASWTAAAEEDND